MDFRRRFAHDKYGANAVEGTVIAIEYDPMRSSRIALVEYKDNEKRYIIAAKGMEEGHFTAARRRAGIATPLPLAKIPAAPRFGA